MLQRIHDALGRWLALLVLGLVMAGFVFWGVQRNSLGTTSTFAAKVNGENLSLSEFERELQSAQNRFQQQYRTELSEDMRRELRRSVIEGMVSNAVLTQRVTEAGYRASDKRLKDIIQSAPLFQDNGQFSFPMYSAWLQNQGFSEPSFLADQRVRLEAEDLQGGILDSTFLTPAEFRRYIEVHSERREVAYALFDVDAFAAGVIIADSDIAVHYESNQASYQTTETADLEYLELALADIAATVQVDEAELRGFYDEERERYQLPEERHARHILISVPDGQEDAARARAESVAARLRGGEDFAKVAAEVSDDAGNKAQGGDLGWMGHDEGDPLKDALFALQPGEISAPVRTSFGYHILRFDELRSGEAPSFEALRDELAVEYKTREAEKEFSDRAENLENSAFNAYNELATVVAATHLPLKTLAGFARSGDPATFANSAPVVQAAFSPEVLENGRNSDLVTLADDHVLVLRVTAHHPPVVKPLEEVREQIKQELTRARAEVLAEEAADAFLADFKTGGDGAALAAARKGAWHAAAWVDRTDATIPTELLAAAFALPKPVGGTVVREQAALANGAHAVLAVSATQVGEPSSVTQTDRDQQQSQLAQQSALAELSSYADNLRAQASVRIPPDILEPQR